MSSVVFDYYKIIYRMIIVIMSFVLLLSSVAFAGMSPPNDSVDGKLSFAHSHALEQVNESDDDQLSSPVSAHGYASVATLSPAGDHLDMHTLGVTLLIAAFVLFLLELFVTSFGVLGVLSFISLCAGFWILNDYAGFSKVSVDAILTFLILSALLMFLVVYLVTKAQVSKSELGLESMIGLGGLVLSADGLKIKVQVRGEIWNAESYDNDHFVRGDKIEVRETRGLVLIIVKKS